MLKIVNFFYRGNSKTPIGPNIYGGLKVTSNTKVETKVFTIGRYLKNGDVTLGEKHIMKQTVTRRRARRETKNSSSREFTRWDARR